MTAGIIDLNSFTGKLAIVAFGAACGAMGAWAGDAAMAMSGETLGPVVSLAAGAALGLAGGFAYLATRANPVAVQSPVRAHKPLLSHFTACAGPMPVAQAA